MVTQKFVFRCITSIVALMVVYVSLTIGQNFDQHIPFKSSLDGLPRLIHLYQWLFPPCILTIHTVTIICIWSDFRFSYVIACMGILVMFVEPILILGILQGF